MLPFSYRSFKEHLQGNLERAESRFMIKTFVSAAAYFFLFAILLIICNHIVKDSYSWLFGIGSTLLGCICSIPLVFASIKYRANPLRVPKTFVATIFGLLTISWLFLFLGISSLITQVLKFQDSERSVNYCILVVFGMSFFLYMIPAIAALIIQNRRTIIKVGRFLNACYLIYFFMFLISIIIAFAGFDLRGWQMFMFIIVTVLVMLSPVLTVYRMKTVSHYINYDDDEERSRWENYFIFEITYQLLQLAFHVMRIACSIISRR